MLTLAREAMATRFELVLYGDKPVALRAAGEEALDEIEALHRQLSLYSPASEIAHINARAAHGPVRVEPRLFRLLALAQQLHRETGGAFDITIAPLMKCWGFMNGSGHMPEAQELAECKARVGMHLVKLDPEEFTIEFAREGVMLDLGAIGKGYAVERAAAILHEAGVTSAFLHGGTSTMHALGAPPDAEAWKVAIDCPDPNWIAQRSGGAGDFAIHVNRSGTDSSEASSPKRLLAVIPLKDGALSVSATWGKFFRAGDRAYGHILDPRTGYPASKTILTAVALPSATETDALSTALLTLGGEGHDDIARLRPTMRTLAVEPVAGLAGPERFRIQTRGIVIRPPLGMGGS